MEDGMSSAYAVIVVGVAVFVLGWICGQIFPWRCLRHPVARISGEGGIE